ncbi:hypothetical protein [Caldicellulosiruptor saccharolyticus]|nr:hypothetical protein [Caldicellulosiruptor saccharolyticus]
MGYGIKEITKELHKSASTILHEVKQRIITQMRN